MNTISKCEKQHNPIFYLPMGEPCQIIEFSPAQVQARDSRTYEERDVKTILYAFARDYEHRRKIEPPMRADALKKFIASVFEF